VSVNGARDTVVKLDVQLRQSVLIVDRSFVQVTHGSGFNNVAHGEALDGLVLWDAASAVDAAYWLDVTTALLAASVISPLSSLLTNNL
jgi:hypothetical protein